MIRPTCQIRSILIITSYLREPYQVLSYLSAVTGGPVAIYETCAPHYSSVYQMPYSSSTAPLQSHLPSAPCIPLSACGKRSFKSIMHFAYMLKKWIWGEGYPSIDAFYLICSEFADEGVHMEDFLREDGIPLQVDEMAAKWTKLRVARSEKEKAAITKQTDKKNANLKMARIK